MNTPVGLYAIQLPRFELILLDNRPEGTDEFSALFGGEAWSRFERLVNEIPVEVGAYSQLLSRDRKRFYIADYLSPVGLSDNDLEQRRRLLGAAEELVRPLVRAFRQRFAKHTRVGISVLVSAPGATSQKCHCDFSAHDLAGLPLDELPFSLLLPITGDVILDVYEKGKGREKRVWTAPVGYCFRFRGDTWHAGGENPADTANHRIHLYFCTDKVKLPVDAVYV